MLKKRIVEFLKIRPEETRMVVLTAALFLLVQAGQAIGENAAYGLFLSSVEVDYLPYMYMGLGVVVFIASIFYSASLSRFQNSSVALYLFGAAAILFLLEWIVIALFEYSVSYPVLWLTTYGAGGVVGTALWMVAGEICDARQAKRLFPLFTSMGILGSVVGNLLSGLIADIVKWVLAFLPANLTSSGAGAQSLIIVYAFLLGAGFWVTRQITARYFIPETDAAKRFSVLDDLRLGYSFMRGSQLFRIIAISSILYSILYFTVDFPFNERISSAYLNDAEGLVGFKGLFTGITTAVTFLVSLFLANRLYARLGIVNSVLIMPLTYAAAFAIFFISFTFWGAVGARFGQLVILGGLGGTAWNALFNVIPTDRRGQVLAFNNGVPAQIGVVLSGVLIILSRQVLETQSILLLGAFVAVVTVYITLKMRPAYGDALLTALKAGRTEVFTEDTEDFSEYHDDPAAVQVTLKALDDTRPLTRRLAVDMLARMGSKLAIPDIVERLSDEDASVRTAAVQALVDLDARAAFKHILLGLGDEDDSVREQTLASLPKLDVASTPELIRTLDRLLGDSSLKIASHAAVVLIYYGETTKALPFIKQVLKDKDAIRRSSPFVSYRVISSKIKTRIPFDKELVRTSFKDPAPVVRREAIRTASFMMDEQLVEEVAVLLADPDPGVRRNASESLKQAWELSRGVLLNILKEGDGLVLVSALDAIPSGEAGLLDDLLGYIHREVASIQHWHSLLEPLPSKGRMVKLLKQILLYRISLCEGRLVKAVGLFGNPRAMELVRKGLAGDSSARAAALEALETLGDKRITAEVLPVLESGKTEPNKTKKIVDVVNILLASEEVDICMLGMFVIADLELDEFVPMLRQLSVSDDKWAQNAARDALSRMGGTSIMKLTKNLATLRTLTTLDRILFLREVPMFSRLSPDDLEQIADIAEEQLFMDGSFLCREGESGDTLFIITDGVVDVVKMTENEERVLASQTPGNYVGEMAVLESAPRSATLKAHGNVRVLVIGGNAFNTILLDRPEVAVSVLKHMSSRVRELNERVGTAA